MTQAINTVLDVTICDCKVVAKHVKDSHRYITIVLMRKSRSYIVVLSKFIPKSVVNCQ